MGTGLGVRFEAGPEWYAAVYLQGVLSTWAGIGDKARPMSVAEPADPVAISRLPLPARVFAYLSTTGY